MSNYNEIEPGFYTVRVFFHLKDGSITVEYHDRYFISGDNAREEIKEIVDDLKRQGGHGEMVTWRPRQ